ncbi:MAG: ABC transporter substrate-binding protein [Candidatus Hermodarchaeota archaeon]
MKIDGKWKKPVIIVLSIALIANGITSLFLITPGPQSGPLPLPLHYRTLVVGTLEGPSELDPINSFDKYSEDVITQVCEGLYQHNLSDPDLEIIPILAADYGTWNAEANQLTIPLRQGVYFQDGTKFNASSVQWTFERINYFINASGMPLILNETISKTHSLYEFPNGTTIFDPINPVTLNSEYSVTINLRGSYAILESLLCHVSAFILSSISTPKYEYIHPVYGRLVGTGPFILDNYVVDEEVKLRRWDNYWRWSAFFKEVTFTVFNDAITRNNAMLDHTIDYLIGSWSSLFPTFDFDPTITHISGIKGLSYHFLDLNNYAINKTWRQAISYGINYTYLINELQAGTVYRSNGPLALNFPGFDPNIQAATYNLTKAREIVVSMGFGNMSWSEAQWFAAEFKILNYSFNVASDFREDLLILLQDNLYLLGITVKDSETSWVWPWWWSYQPDWRTQHLAWREIHPSYLSPYHILYRLYSNESTENGYKYHNHDVENWLEQVLQEPNVTAREMLYSNILHQIVEVDMPHAFCYHPYLHYIHSADIMGVQYNSMGRLSIYPMYRA